MLSTLSKTEIIIFGSFNLSSSKVFNLVWSNILSSVNGLNLSQKSPGFYVTAVKKKNGGGGKEKLFVMNIFSFFFATCFENFLLFLYEI